jgi:hypothetical protein
VTPPQAGIHSVIRNTISVIDIGGMMRVQAARPLLCPLMIEKRRRIPAQDKAQASGHVVPNTPARHGISARTMHDDTNRSAHN